MPPVAPAPQPVMPAALGPENNSGTGGTPPRAVLDMGYCWPGFLFSRLWRDAHHIPMNWLNGGLNMSLTMGQSGYKLAWQHRRFASLRQFQDTMKAWQTAAKVVPVVLMIFLIIRTGIR